MQVLHSAAVLCCYSLLLYSGTVLTWNAGVTLCCCTLLLYSAAILYYCTLLLYSITALLIQFTWTLQTCAGEVGAGGGLGR
jgi:hypothetical protein